YARIPQAPDRYGFYVDVKEYELGDLNKPPNYKATFLDPEFDKWLEAMNKEMQSMKDNQFWALVDLPPNGRTVRNIRAIRILLAIATFYDYEIWKMDVKTSFLNGHLSEDTAVKAILKYLRNTNDMVLTYGAKPEAKLKVSCYTNASFQTDKDDTKSQTGYVFILNGGVMDWKSAKKSTTAMPFTKAQYIVIAEASVEAVWMRKFIDGLGGVMPSNKRPMEMLCKNEFAIAIANDPGILKGARHFQRKYHYIREVIHDRDIILKKVYTYDNVADPFTKPMPFNKHYEHVMAIGIVPASSLM
nr:hypothetical protein [Tanacetum cinerariifolium]